MRLKRVQVDGYYNLNKLDMSFDSSSMTTVLLGPNGSGKSYLLEAISEIFRAIDLEQSPPVFSFELEYAIGSSEVVLAASGGEWQLKVDGDSISRSDFRERKFDLLPDTIFAYYSGDNNRLENIFYSHQQKYYRSLVSDRYNDQFKSVSISDRRLFYARPIHGVLALFALMAAEDETVNGHLEDMVGITGFHSAMMLLRKPWYAKGRAGTDAANFWGAAGRPGRAARLARKHSFFPMERTEPARDDYRSQNKAESQLALFIKDREALVDLANNFQTDLDFFEELESIDISDLYRWVQVWVTRDGVEDGDISYGSLSEGERQLLMVLGLIRLSRNKRVLFLLDEPDTHLNPRWQYQYHSLIDKWSSASADRCHILLTTHNPLMVGNLRKEQVRVFSTSESGTVSAKEPEDDPLVMGIEGLLKSELFGLRTTLSPFVIGKIDRHHLLLAKDELDDEELIELRSLAAELNEMGVSLTHPNPYFEAFAKAMAKRLPKRDLTLSSREISEQAELADDILEEILAEERAEQASGLGRK
jgi:ABC-type transport system involved in cytochrome c biogenesis ATPase subunit